MTDFVKKSVQNKKTHVDLVLSILPSKNRFFEFDSDMSRSFHPTLFIKDDINKYSLKPVITENFNNNFLNTQEVAGNSLKIMNDGTLPVSNQVNGLLRFDITSIDSPQNASLKLYIKDLSLGEDYKQINYTVGQSLKVLKNLQQYLERKDIDFYMFDTYYYSGIEEFRNLCSDSMISYFSLDVDRKDDYHFGKLDSHSSQNAHKVMADSLYKKLAKNNIIPKQYLNITFK